jgi:membrane-bound metal-dependent hydrolase YbcI (DUF457 family)
MLGVNDVWVLLGLLATSVVVTLVANWAVARVGRATPLAAGSLAAWFASLTWIVALFAAGVIATRYVERISRPAVGYVVFGFMAVILSVMRALLYRKVPEQPQTGSAREERGLARSAMPNGVYLLFAVSLFLFLHLLLDQPAYPLLIFPLCVGALLPELDRRESVVGRLLPFLSQRLESRFGHRQEWHSLGGAVVVALAAAPLILVAGVRAWYPVPLGFVAHLLVDLLQEDGLMLLWPVSRTRYNLFGRVMTHVPARQRMLGAALAVVVLLLLLMVDLGPRPVPPAAPPSYEQVVDRYYSLRGRYLVFASLEGTWQATGRWMSGSFEILNASGQSFTMLDRFTGSVFSAGRDALVNCYVQRITLQTGVAVQVKPVEIHLEKQTLADALPVLYEMQQEPGLQHIYVSGDLQVAGSVTGTDRILDDGYSQTALRRVRLLKPGHYNLRYLTAAELIGMADTAVERADLVIVATAASPATGPTPTALPSPPQAPEVGP